MVYLKVSSAFLERLTALSAYIEPDKFRALTSKVIGNFWPCTYV